MSLTQHKTPAILVNELLFSRAAFHGSFLVLEGPDDQRFWARRIEKGSCKCVLSHAKTTLKRAFERLDQRGFRGAVGVVDADLDHLEDRHATSPNVIPTDTVDLEAFLLRTPALESVLLELGEPSKIEAFERRSGHDVRTALLHRALPLGKLRWLSERRKLGIAMDAFSPYKYVDERTWILDEVRLVHDAARSVTTMTEGQLRAKLDALPARDSWQIVHGKDMVKILDIGLKRLLGSKSHAEHVSRLLRQGINTAELVCSSLGRAIMDWEGRNPPFVILARPPM